MYALLYRGKVVAKGSRAYVADELEYFLDVEQLRWDDFRIELWLA